MKDTNPMPQTPSTAETDGKTDGNSYTLIIDAPEKEQGSSRPCLVGLLGTTLLTILILGIVAMAATFGAGWYAQDSDPVPSDSVRVSIPADMTLEEYLAQQEAARPLFRTPPRSILFPNLETLGRGYNVFLGDPRAPGVNADPGVTRNQPIFQIYNEDTNGVQVLPGERCTTNFVSNMVYGLSSYRSTLESSVGVSAGVSGAPGMLGGSFSASSSWRDVRSATNSNRRLAVDSIAECSFYEASIVVPQAWDTSRRAPLSQAFIDAINFLASRRPTTRDFEDVIDHFGTHAIFNNMRMGSLVGSRREVTTTTFLSFQRRGWDMEMAASLSIGVATFGSSISRSRDREMSEEFENQVERRSEFTIGTTPRRQAWDSAGGRASPVAIAFDLLDLASIISTYSDLDENSRTRVSQGMQSALAGYCATLARRGVRVTCNDPDPDNIPVEAPIPRFRTCMRSTVAHGGGGGASFGSLRHPNIATAAHSSMTQIRLGLSGGLINGNRINHLQFVSQLATGTTWTSSRRGGGGMGWRLSVPAGRRVTQVSIRSGVHVDWLQFRFDNGETRQYGGGGGVRHTFNFAASGRRNPRLIGFHGRSGGVIDQLGFIFAYEVAEGSQC
jgi:hypothetical protein